MKLFPKRDSSLYGYLYLFQLIIPACFLILLPLDKALLGLVLLLLFALCFIATFRVNGKLNFLLIGLETLIMMVLAAALNFGYFWLGFYPVAAMAQKMDKRQLRIAVPLFLLLCMAELAVLLAKTKLLWYEVIPYTVLGLIGLIAMLYGVSTQRKNEQAKQALEKANGEIERLTKIAERERISQDLHDVMGHELSMISLKSQLIERLLDRDIERARIEVRDIEEAARKALARVREYIRDIRQTKLHEEWADGVKLLCASGFICSADDGAVILPAVHPGNQTLSMCLREAITNIVRHSRATEVTLRLAIQDDQIELLIADNGVGFTEAKIATHFSGQAAGYGLTGMRARLAALGGQFRMYSNGKELGDAVWRSPAQSNTALPWQRGLTLRLSIPFRIEENVSRLHSQQEATTP